MKGRVLFLASMIFFCGQTAAASWLLHAAIPVEAGTDAFAFAGGDFNGDGFRDLYAIKEKDTGTGRTEVHVLDGRNRFQSFLLQRGTALEPSYGKFSFALGDYDRDGRLDLYAVKTLDTGSGRAEIHILDGKTSFGTFLLHAPIPVEQSSGVFSFSVGDWNGDGYPDLYAIKMANTESGATEVHILDGSKGYQGFLLQTPTCLEISRGIFSFALGDCNSDGRIDLYAVKRRETGSRSTEIHVLNGASGYREFLVHSPTPLEEAGDDFLFDVGDYNGDRLDDLYAIKRQGTSTKWGEVHVLGGIRGKSPAKQGVLLHAPLGESTGMNL